MNRHIAASCGVILATCLASAAWGAPAGEKLTSQRDQQELAITIYNDNLALVKDLRRVTLARGANQLAWRDVSALIMPETALLRSPGGDGVSLLEQNFDFDLLTPQKLLDKYVGRTVTVIKTNPATGAESSESATVLSTNGGVVLKFADRIETGMPGRIAFGEVPENLRDRPTLVISLVSPAAGERALELSYLTHGLSWRADYVAELSPKDDRLDLNGWVTLSNRSGTGYPDARLQLVAGDVNRVVQALRKPEAALMAKASVEKPQMAEESLFEYHLYTFGHPTTIAENQTKQVALLSASHVPVRKEMVLQGSNYYYMGSYGDLGQKMKIGVFVEFQNAAPAAGEGLGVPLPKGIVRVYKRDSHGNAQFVGEDSIDHTPRNEKVCLKLGEAFDVTAGKKQTDFKKVAGSGRYNYIYEAAFRIELRNAKDVPVSVKVVEPVPGDWEVLEENLPHTKEASNASVWKVDVPANGKTALEYRVRVKY